MRRSSRSHQKPLLASSDSRSKIAKKLDIAGGWKQLWAANPKVGDPNLIYVGHKLQLPA